MKVKDVKQGDIFMCDFSGGAIRNEQKGVRPIVIISVDIRNETSDNVFVFPITHAKKKPQPCHYTLYKEDYPFFSYKENTILCEEGRSISKSRLERKLGCISKEDVQNILICKEFVFVER